MSKLVSSETEVTSDEDEAASKIAGDDEIPSIEENSQSQPLYVVSKPSVSTPVSILIESLIQNICTIYESDQKKQSVMYKVICDKLHSMNLLGESYNMMEFEGIRSQYQRAFLHLLASVKSGDKSIPVSPIWPKFAIHSHYHREFDEVDYIAGGGFGQVYRVKHKLDGTEYAVKKIPIRSDGIQSVRSYLSEVKTFASLNHPNIVQYKGAWLEIGAPSNNEPMIDESSEMHETTHSQHQMHNTEYIYHKKTHSFTEERNGDTTDFQIDFEHSVSGASSVKSKTKSHSQNRIKRKSLSEGEEDKALCNLDIKEIERIRATNRAKIKWATLYIQMALCHSTLKQWLEKRNAVNNPEKAIVHVNDQVIRTGTIIQILTQLLKGLEYIHSKGIVHHDIKPSNIFIQIENNSILIQLGDFGLACPLQSVKHSLAFGTKLYSAPEQLAGKCNPKSDMYSLGIVLFELVENFRTDMERVHYLTDLRKGQIPRDILLKYPDISQMIERLMIKNPDERPDTTTMLNNLKSTESEEIEQLRLQLVEKDEEIVHLKELLKSHGIKSV
ncbi:unnamed protein product [Phaedon cochleariae]|uniref:non-specific serine/threonine protein kinase n=1 Tax=Phaedon cochleariae TaxID=80249 RepID=A0A9P0GPX5_PHACE|nr:unnamed protein product [Phaedon cochleariae]